MTSEFFSNWLFDPTVIKIITLVIGVLLIQWIVHLLQQVMAKNIGNINLRYQTRKLITFAGYALIILFLTLVFNDQLSSLTVAIGVAGAGIAFALQEVIISIAGWFAISFAGFYKISDRVQLGGIKGDVIDISLLRTTLMEIGEWVHGDQYSGRIVRIANSFVFKEPVFNYSGDFPFLWDELTIPVKYGGNYRLARQIIQQAAEDVVGDYSRNARATWETMLNKYMIEEASVEPGVTMVANDNWVEFTLRYVVDYKKRRTTKDLLFAGILEGFDQSDGQVEIASATFSLVEAPKLEINLPTKK